MNPGAASASASGTGRYVEYSVWHNANYYSPYQSDVEWELIDLTNNQVLDSGTVISYYNWINNVKPGTTMASGTLDLWSPHNVELKLYCGGSACEGGASLKVTNY